MAEERRRGLTVAEQKEMYDTVLKLKTILIGNGVKGKLQEFEEADEKLEKNIAIIAQSVSKLEKKFLKVLGPFIAVPGVLATILVVIGIVDKLF